MPAGTAVGEEVLLHVVSAGKGKCHNERRKNGSKRLLTELSRPPRWRVVPDYTRVSSGISFASSLVLFGRRMHAANVRSTKLWRKALKAYSLESEIITVGPKDTGVRSCHNRRSAPEARQKTLKGRMGFDDTDESELPRRKGQSENQDA